MLKTMVAAEVGAVLDRRPNLAVVMLVHGTKYSLMFLTRALPDIAEQRRH